LAAFSFCVPVREDALESIRFCFDAPISIFRGCGSAVFGT
jgi:hypothetical protein